MLALGAFAEVLEPPELRARMIAAARDIIDRYATSSTAQLVSAAAGGSAGPPPHGSGRIGRRMGRLVDRPAGGRGGPLAWSVLIEADGSVRIAWKADGYEAIQVRARFRSREELADYARGIADEALFDRTLAGCGWPCGPATRARSTW